VVAVTSMAGMATLPGVVSVRDALGRPGMSTVAVVLGVVGVLTVTLDLRVTVRRHGDGRGVVVAAHAARSGAVTI